MTIGVDAAFWHGRRVLLTGHTGFKGAWTALWLTSLGARVTGLALPPEGEPNLFDLLGPIDGLDSRIVDLREPGAVAQALADQSPEIVIHMAAQAIVLRAYRDPIATFASNVMGTANLLEALRTTPALRAILVVTSDKVYRNDASGNIHHETDPLGGTDPYSASKAATEIMVRSWGESYFTPRGITAVTARAGNVIGGGDWGEQRLVPDIWRSIREGRPPVLRNPDGVRPWQHVLDCIAGYLIYVQHVVTAPANSLPHALNFGPPPDRIVRAAEIASAFLAVFERPPHWDLAPQPASPEQPVLRLDPSAAAKQLGWRTRLDLARTLSWSAQWYKDCDQGRSARAISLAQIAAYQALEAA